MCVSAYLRVSARVGSGTRACGPYTAPGAGPHRAALMRRQPRRCCRSRPRRAPAVHVCAAPDASLRCASVSTLVHPFIYGYLWMPRCPRTRASAAPSALGCSHILVHARKYGYTGVYRWPGMGRRASVYLYMYVHIYLTTSTSLLYLYVRCM